MYEVDSNTRAFIESRTRYFEWTGMIQYSDNATYYNKTMYFSMSDIVQGTGVITRTLSSDGGLKIGGVYSSELTISLRLSISRYKLYGGKIVLWVQPVARHMSTWGDLGAFTWEGISGRKWYELARHERIFMGTWYISEMSQEKGGILNITAYDGIERWLDQKASDYSSYSPNQLLYFASSVSGGYYYESSYNKWTEGDRSLPNANRVVRFSVTNEKFETYRDYFAKACEALCVNAVNARSDSYWDGIKLVPYTNEPVKTIRASRRFSSVLSDYKCYYSGMYATFLEGEVSEYFSNTQASGRDDGLVYNMGANPFLQFPDAAVRRAALQEIMDLLSGFVYVPFSASIPFDPTLDIGDVVRFEDNQARSSDIGMITNMTVRINGEMEISCDGDNPKLNAAQNRFTRNISGLLESSNALVGSQSFWMVTAENTQAYDVGNGSVTVMTAQFTTSVQYTRAAVAITVTFTLTASATITLVTSAPWQSYATTETLQAGQHTMTQTHGGTIQYKGTHAVSVTMLASDTETAVDALIRDLTARVKALEDKEDDGNGGE